MYIHFPETYFDHSCTMKFEKDVLELDIENNCFATLKRWWYNLFLVSYDDARARNIYMSTQAIKLERLKQFRYCKNCIHPFSQFRNFWDIMILTVVLLNKLIFHLNTSILLGNLPLSLYFLGVFFELIIICDVLINAKTGYVDQEERKVVTDKRKVMIKYFSTKFFFHTLSAIPLQGIMFLRYGLNINCSYCKSNLFVCVLRLFNVIGYFRLYDASGYWSRERGSFKVTHFFKFFRIFVIGLMTMLQIVTLTDTVRLMTIISSGEIDETSYYYLILKMKFLEPNPPSDIIFLCNQFSRICKSFLLFGYNLYPNENNLDQVSALTAFVVANLFYVWSLMICYACLSRMNFQEDQMKLNEERTVNMMRCRQLPDSFTYKVLQYYKFNWTAFTVIEKQNGLFASLPYTLRREILLNCHSRHIKKIPFMATWPVRIINDLVLLLKEFIFLRGDTISEAHTQGDGLVIIDAGEAAVYSMTNEETGHLIDGDYFGDLSLVTDKEVRLSYVVAVCHCRVLFLDKADFRKYMRQYPEMFFEMKQRVREKYSNKTTNLTPSHTA